MKWPKLKEIPCNHELGISVIYYIIFDIIVYNQIVKFDILNYHELDSDHGSLTLTLKFVNHISSITKNYNNCWP